MSVLIVSLPGDAHALATEWALKAKGIDARYICWSDYPQKLQASYELGQGLEGRLTIHDDGAPLPEQFRTIWNHRTCTPEPHPSIDPADHEPIRISADRALRGLAAHVELRAFAVNPSRSKWYFDNKPTQLNLAVQVGFDVPPTLISNHPDEIEAFIQKVGACVAKPLKYMHWDTGQSDIELFTTPIESIRGFDPEAVSACPLIYQQQIRKATEYRVVVFGRQVVCFEILSQKSVRYAADWRMSSFKGLEVRLANLPIDLERRIFDYMDRCGFVYGSLDFAVTEDDRIVFFEINETGQFLWLEELIPEVPLLDMFSDFLATATPDFRYRPNAAPLRFSDWLSDGIQRLAETVPDASRPSWTNDFRIASQNPPEGVLFHMSMLPLLLTLLTGDPTGQAVAIIPDPETCVLSLEDRINNRSLPFNAFDQQGVTAATARKLGERECNNTAAEATEDYLLFGPQVTEYQRNVLSWHLAQFLALAGREEEATRVIATTRRTAVDEADGFDWNTYVVGTWAFLRKDRETLDAAQATLSTAPGVRNSMNARVLRRLQTCFDRSYRAAYRDADCAVD